MSALRRLETADRRALEETFPDELTALAVEHAAVGLLLVPGSFPFDGVPKFHLGGDPRALVSELIRLARVGAYAEMQARLFPHTKISTVVRKSPGAR